MRMQVPFLMSWALIIFDWYDEKFFANLLKNHIKFQIRSLIKTYPANLTEGIAGQLVRMKGLEPLRPRTLDPKSNAATNYATRACKDLGFAVQSYAFYSS